jgi:hypothetical protein
MSKYYTGVGSRNTPEDILELMTRLAIKLEGEGWTLRSGGAKGADTAFAKRVALDEVYFASDATKEAMKIAALYHPAWDRCSDYAKKLHGRNAFQVLGKSLDNPSKFLMCWTPDGCVSHAERTIETGGTGTAISIADAHGVKIFNLARDDHRKRVEEFLAK